MSSAVKRLPVQTVCTDGLLEEYEAHEQNG